MVCDFLLPVLAASLALAAPGVAEDAAAPACDPSATTECSNANTLAFLLAALEEAGKSGEIKDFGQLLEDDEFIVAAGNAL